MALKKNLRQFFFPSLTPKFLLRILGVAFVSYGVFSQVLIPMRIHGISMEPTYRDGTFNFCWRLHSLFSEPQRHDVVAVRFAGNKIMLLKRVVALEGEQIEFRGGKLWVDGKVIEEAYVRYPCDWNLPPRVVEKGSVYVVGDNRNMPIESHHFGQASIKRIVGVPLW
jgi:signal peptidase I